MDALCDFFVFVHFLSCLSVYITITCERGCAVSGQTELWRSLAACLPQEITCEAAELIKNGVMAAEDITEIRLRAGTRASVTCRGRNVTLSVTLSEAQVLKCVTNLCRGSVYAHSETIRMGYIRYGDGVRVGVVGELAADGRAMAKITYVNIRIPHAIRGVAGGLYSLCNQNGQISPMLIYSSPGEGKTTALRDLAAKFGQDRRVCVIDTRGELFIERMFCGTLCDFLIGYSKAQGIEIAVRTMSPELLICDELGDAAETQQILSTVSTGVPIIASAHAGSISELMSRPNIRMLHDGHVFSLYVGIRREVINGVPCRSFVCDAAAWGDVP